MRLAFFTLLIAVGAFALPQKHIYSDSDSVVVKPTINDTVPMCVEVGEMARLEVTGDRVAWECVPSIPDGQAFADNNQKFVCSFRQPGLYVVVAAVYVDDQVSIRKFPIRVGMLEPVPAPSPAPEPTVAPDPMLVSVVLQWCKDTNADKTQCGLVSGVLSQVASEIKDGKLTNADAIILRTAELNSELNLTKINKLMRKIQEYISREADAGRLVDPTDYAVTWKSLAEGLKQYEAGK